MSRVHGSGVWVNLGKNILARLVCVCLFYCLTESEVGSGQSL